MFRKSTVAIASLLLLLTSCVSEPVVEKLLIAFGTPDALVDVTASVEIRDEAEDDTPLAARLDRLRDDLIAERDFWSTRFRIVNPPDDEYRRERSRGKISKVIRRAFMDRNDLARLLDGFAALSFISGPGWEEMGMDVARSNRATSQEKRIVAAKLDRWSQQFANHVAAVAKLLRYLDGHPDQARVLVARVLVMEGLDSKYRSVKLTDEEEEMVTTVTEGNQNLLAILAETEETAWTFEEMTRHVYDPFPSEITVTTPGVILECQGFVCREDRVARVPKLSLAGILPHLERWASPDPLMAMMAEGEDNLEKDLDTFLARPRSIATSLPGAIEVRSTIEQQLIPATTYRLRWRVSAAGTAGSDAFSAASMSPGMADEIFSSFFRRSSHSSKALRSSGVVPGAR